MLKLLIPILLVSCGVDQGLVDKFTAKHRHYKIHTDVPERLHEPIHRAAYQWNAVIGYEVLIYDGTTSESFKDSLTGDDENVIYNEHPNYSQATATTKTKHIGFKPFEFDIFLNTKLRDFQDVDKPHIQGLHFEKINDMESVMLHEFGHALGLQHIDNIDSVMYRSFDGEYGVKKRELQTEEKEQIKNIWSDS